MSFSRMCHHVILAGTDVLEESIASIFRVKTINGLNHISSSQDPA
jgi:hypothetical protein